MKRSIVYIITIFFILFSGILLLAFNREKSIQFEYWDGYNNVRYEKGIYPLTKASDTIIESWGNIFPENQRIKWKRLLSNKELPTTSTFNYDSLELKPFHHSKTICFSTRLCFWQNYYYGETDVFIYPVSMDTLVELVVTYYSSDAKPGDFFYTNIDTVYKGKSEELGCVEVLELDFIEEIEQEPKGNITKTEADSILRDWNLIK